MKTPVLGIVGWSGSGKTTLLEYVLPRLTGLGLRVNVIKHAHHPLSANDRGKDSFRFQAAGAADVHVTASADGREPDLQRILGGQARADLVLVEGFKRAPIPKLEIYRPGLGEPALYPHDAHIVAVATDAAPPSILRHRLVWLNIHQPAQVLSWMQVFIGTQLHAMQYPASAMRGLHPAVIL